MMTTQELLSFIVFVIYRFVLAVLALIAIFLGHWLLGIAFLALAFMSSFHVKGGN